MSWKKWHKKTFTTREGFVENQGAAAAPALYGPATITGCTGFWDFNNSSSLTLNTGKISQAADLSGGTAHMKQPGASSICPTPNASGGYNDRGYASFALSSGTFLRTDSAFTVCAPTEFSFAVRFKAADPGANNRGTLIGRTVGVNPNIYLICGENAGQSDNLLGFAGDGVGGVGNISTATAFDNTWHTAIMTFSSDTLNYFVDGSAGGTVVGTPSTLATTQTMAIGGLGAALYLTGDIEYVATYSRVLSAGDITTLQSYGA